MQQDSATTRPSRPDLLAAALNMDLPTFAVPRLGFLHPRTESFQLHLEREHELTEDSAQRLEAEYRRYIYLKALEGGDLTPSRRVDQAWYLHMETLGSEWDPFCESLFGKRIARRTDPVSIESQADYERTLALYRQEFGVAPPPDIWPGETERERVKFAKQMRGYGFISVLIGFVLFIPLVAAGPIPSAGIFAIASGILAFFLFLGGISVLLSSNTVLLECDLKRNYSD